MSLPATEQEKTDFRESLAGLSGHLTAQVIHAHHVQMMAVIGRPPMTAARLGQLLTEYGAIRKAKWDVSKTSVARTEAGKQKGQMVKGWIL